MDTETATPARSKAKAPKGAPKTPAPKKVAPAPAAAGLKTRVTAAETAARTGKLPSPPDFSAETHKRFRGKLEQLTALVKAKDVAALKAFDIKPFSSSPKALDRYRNLAVIALEVKAAKGKGGADEGGEPI